MRKQDDRLVIYVFFGLIGAGKSTLALAWAKNLGLACLNSDRVRKELAGPDKSGAGLPFNQGLYAEDFTRKTYNSMLDTAAAELKQGRSVVLDASFRCRADRKSVRRLAKKHGAQVRFVLCSCPESELKRRLEIRSLEPSPVSDGRWEIYLRQKDLFEEPAELGPEELTTISTMAPLSRLLARLSKAFS